MKTRCLMTIAAFAAFVVSGAQGSTTLALMGTSQIDNSATTDYSCIVSNLGGTSISVTISIYAGNGTLIFSSPGTVPSHTSFGIGTPSKGLNGAFCLATATVVKNLRGYFKATDTNGNVLDVRDMR